MSRRRRFNSTRCILTRHICISTMYLSIFYDKWICWLVVRWLVDVYVDVIMSMCLCQCVYVNVFMSICWCVYINVLMIDLPCFFGSLELFKFFPITWTFQIRSDHSFLPLSINAFDVVIIPFCFLFCTWLRHRYVNHVMSVGPSRRSKQDQVN